MAIVTLHDTLFFNNFASNDGIITIATDCSISFQNLRIEVNSILKKQLKISTTIYLFFYSKNLTTTSAGIIIMNGIKGSLTNISIINHNSSLGPSFSFVSLSIQVICKNITISSNLKELYYGGKYAVLWNSNVSLSNFNVISVQSKGLFDIQFNSYFYSNDISFRDSSCQSKGKGCIFFLDSKSLLILKSLDVYNVTTFNSLIYLENSQANLSNIRFDVVKLDSKSTDGYLIILDSSNSSFENLYITNINSKFSYLTFSNLILESSVFDNENIKNVIQAEILSDRKGKAFFYLYQSLNAIILNSTFKNLGDFDFGVLLFIFF